MRNALVGKTIKDIIFHDSHGMMFDFCLDDGSVVTITCYGTGHKNHFPDEMYIAVNGNEIT